ncbi:MAG: transposase, partial [Candidatus Omnitrophota bacterium]
GHLWQGRFYSCILEHEHLYSALRYVERNPVRAGMVVNAWDWEWSSAVFHVGESVESKIKLDDISDIIDPESIKWKEYIGDKENLCEMKELRKCTMLGRPWGGEDFIKILSKKLGCNLFYRKKGRPRNRK